MPAFNIKKQMPNKEFNPCFQESFVLTKSLIANSKEEPKNPNDLDENYSLPLEVELFDTEEIPQQPFPTYKEVLEQQKLNNPEAFWKS